jgi:hypothetical protein
MSAIVDDSELEAITIELITDPDEEHSIAKAKGPAASKLVQDFIDCTHWRHLKNSGRGIAGRSSASFDLQAFQYLPCDDFPDLTGFPPSVRVGIHVYDVDVSIPAFERLMLRFLRLAIDRANISRNEVLKEEWWPQFLADVDTLERRVRSV